MTSAQETFSTITVETVQAELAGRDPDPSPFEPVQSST